MFVEDSTDISKPSSLTADVTAAPGGEGQVVHGGISGHFLIVLLVEHSFCTQPSKKLCT